MLTRRRTLAIWTTPVIASVVLPAHAQTTACDSLIFATVSGFTTSSDTTSVTYRFSVSIGSTRPIERIELSNPGHILTAPASLPATISSPSQGRVLIITENSPALSNGSVTIYYSECPIPLVYTISDATPPVLASP